jgi:soluble lytic murein transglycosylase-like protein
MAIWTMSPFGHPRGPLGVEPAPGPASEAVSSARARQCAPRPDAPKHGKRSAMPRIANHLPRAWVALGVAAAMAAAPAGAQVLEIGSDGAVTTYSGPTIYSSDGVRSLTPQVRSAGPMRATPAEIAREIRAASLRHAISAPLVEAVAWQESRFNQSAVSPKGAMGVMQLMPATARQLGVDARDVASNIEGGALYLSQMLRRFEGDVPRALAAYNAGPEAVQRYGGIPPYAETQAYVRAILGRLGAVGGLGAHAE